jgi:hypothetical protein
VSRIKELEDVLTLVDEMPREWQMKCVGTMIYYVDKWEERQQAPGLSDREWALVLRERHEAQRRRRKEQWRLRRKR